MRVVTFKMSEDLLEALDKYALMNGMSRSDVIRKAIVSLISSREIPRFRYRVKKVYLT